MNLRFARRLRRSERFAALIAVAVVLTLAATLLSWRSGVGPDLRTMIAGPGACALLLLAVWVARTPDREQWERAGLALALEHSTVIVCALDGTIQYWPQSCEALYGWTAKEAIGRPGRELFGMETPERRAEIQAAIERDGEWQGELQQHSKDGKVRWIANHWVRQDRGPNGEARLVGTLNDVTSLKLAKAALFESEERLRLAVDAYDLGIADADMVARTMVTDRGFERILALPPGGLQGSLDKLNAMVVSKDPDRDAAIAARKPQQIDEVRMRRGDGEIRDFHGVRRFFYSPEGAHLRTIGIYRDVTDERRAEQEIALRGDHLAELRSELAHVSRLSTMGEMAAGFAHELNQPLTAIGNSVGALKIMLGDGGKSLNVTTRARVVRAANHAEGQAVRAGEIVRRLRDFIARGEADARIEEIAPLIEESVALAAPSAKADEVEILLKLSPDAGCVLADRIQIQQILVNLIRNALEAMRGTPAPHILTIATAARGDMVEVSVKDSGTGVAPEFAKELFSPFRSTKHTGMGVGLSICRRIVEAHGGRMWLEWSESGADFRFTIPSGSEETRHAA